MTFYILKVLSWLGIVWDLKTPPEPVLRNEQRLGARVINRAAEQLAANFHGVPSRDELVAQARAMFAKTSSLDEIVDRALELLHTPAVRAG